MEGDCIRNNRRKLPSFDSSSKISWTFASFCMDIDGFALAMPTGDTLYQAQRQRDAGWKDGKTTLWILWILWIQPVGPDGSLMLCDALCLLCDFDIRTLESRQIIRHVSESKSSRDLEQMGIVLDHWHGSCRCTWALCERPGFIWSSRPKFVKAMDFLFDLRKHNLWKVQKATGLRSQRLIRTDFLAPNIAQHLTRFLSITLDGSVQYEPTIIYYKSSKSLTAMERSSCQSSN